MMPFELVLEVRRLLEEGRLSQRQIAVRLGVSRGTVFRLSQGWAPAVREKPLKRRRRRRLPLPLYRIATRCPGCGGMVYAPCRLCATQEHRRRQVLHARELAARAFGIRRAA